MAVLSSGVPSPFTVTYHSAGWVGTATVKFYEGRDILYKPPDKAKAEVTVIANADLSCRRWAADLRTRHSNPVCTKLVTDNTGRLKALASVCCIAVSRGC
jgi:hypothetical protein